MRARPALQGSQCECRWQPSFNNILSLLSLFVLPDSHQHGVPIVSWCARLAMLSQHPKSTKISSTRRLRAKLWQRHRRGPPQRMPLQYEATSKFNRPQIELPVLKAQCGLRCSNLCSCGFPRRHRRDGVHCTPSCTSLVVGGACLVRRPAQKTTIVMELLPTLPMAYLWL